MFAVIRTGGKQYRVADGQQIVVEKLDGAPGSTVEFRDVLMIADGRTPQVGIPTLDQAVVFAEVIEQSRADKIIVFKKTRRKGYRRRRGHRQDQTVLRITSISATGKKPAPKKAAPAKEKAEAKAKPKAKAAPKKAPVKKAAPKKAAAKQPAAKKKAAAKKAPAKKAAPKSNKSKE